MVLKERKYSPFALAVRARPLLSDEYVFHDTEVKTVLYSIQYKNLLKYKLGCSHNQLSSLPIIVTLYTYHCKDV